MKTNRIFYSNSKASFYHLREEKELRFLKDRFPEGIIISPNYDFEEYKDARVCNATIDTCDMVIVSERKGFIDMGEFIAVTRAFSNKTKVYRLQNNISEYLFFEVFGVEIVDEDDWIEKYARLITSLSVIKL